MDLDMDKLATAAASVAIKELIGGGTSVVKSVWNWIKGKASEDEAADVAKIEGAPDKPSSPDKLKALLKDLLHDQPDLQQELARLLEENGGPSLKQFANVQGDNNIVGQIAGNNNTFKVGK